MTVEAFGPKEVTKEPFPSEIIRQTTEAGQIVWLKSAPEAKETEVTSSQETQSPEV